MDPNKDEMFSKDPEWKRFDEQLETYVPKRDAKAFGTAEGNSFSGNERNRLFMQAGGNFDEATLISGMDFQQDGRGFAILDYDQDGYLDLAVISTQSPRFRLMNNRIDELQKLNAQPNGSVSIRLVGGHQEMKGQQEWSSRDPYGAKLKATIGDATQVFQFACGEGLSAQNSDWIHVGLGNHDQIDELEIEWPSGKSSVHKELVTGNRIVIHENPDEEK